MLNIDYKTISIVPKTADGVFSERNQNTQRKQAVNGILSYQVTDI